MAKPGVKISILLFLYRRIVQDKQPVTLREETPAEPTVAPATGVPAS